VLVNTDRIKSNLKEERNLPLLWPPLLAITFVRGKSTGRIILNTYQIIANAPDILPKDSCGHMLMRQYTISQQASEEGLPWGAP